MITQEMIDRINVLYYKSQAEGLTDDEKEEQKNLRKEYIASVKANMRGSLNTITIKEEDGTLTDLGKKYGKISDIKS